MNQISIMESLIEALKKQGADLEAETRAVKGNHMEVVLLYRFTIDTIKRENKRLQRRVSFLETELKLARDELVEIKSCRDCTFIGCRQCPKEKNNEVMCFEESGEITQEVWDGAQSKIR